MSPNKEAPCFIQLPRFFEPTQFQRSNHKKKLENPMKPREVVKQKGGGFSPTHLKKYAPQIGSFPEGGGENVENV